VGVVAVLEVEGRGVNLPDPPGGSFNAAADYDRLLPLARSLPMLRRIDEHGDIQFLWTELLSLRIVAAGLLRLARDGPERRGLMRLTALAAHGSQLPGSMVRTLDYRTWRTAVLVVLAGISVAQLAACGVVGTQSSVAAACVPGEVVSAGESSGVAIFLPFPGPFREARHKGVDAVSAFELTITNHTGAVIQLNGYSVITYSARGTVIANWRPRYRHGIGTDLSPGQFYSSGPVADGAMTDTTGKFEEADTCKVFVQWSNTDSGSGF
jgi:hypothetical protein